MAIEDDEDEFLYGEPSAKKLKTENTTENSKKHSFKTWTVVLSQQLRFSRTFD